MGTAAQLLAFALSIVRASSLRQELPPYLPSGFAFGFGFTSPSPHGGTTGAPNAQHDLEPHRACDIDRLPSITPEEFNRVYRNKRPLILTQPTDDTWTLNQRRPRSHAGEQDGRTGRRGHEPWVRRGRWSRELLLHKLAGATLKSGSAAKIALFLGRGYEARVPLGEYLEDMQGAEQQRMHGATNADDGSSANNAHSGSGGSGASGHSSHFMEDSYGVDADFFDARRIGPDSDSARGDAGNGAAGAGAGAAGVTGDRRGAGKGDSESAAEREARQELFDSLRFPPALHYMLNSSTLSGRAWPEKLLHVGGTGTGVAPHWHGDTVSHLIHGRKHWVLYPPEDTPLKVDAYWPVRQRRWLEHVASARAHRVQERRLRHQEQEKAQRPPQPPPPHAQQQKVDQDQDERGNRGGQQREPPPPPPPPPRVPLNDVAGAELRHRWEKAPEWAHIAEVESMYEEERAGAQQFVNGSMHCVQRAGELLYVPDSWVHATINIGETISVSTQQHPVPRALLWRLQLAVVGDGGGEPPSPLDSVKMLSELATEFAGNALVLFTMARVLGLAVQQGTVALPALQQQLEQQRQALMAAQHEDEAERDAQLVRTILRRQGEIVIATFERAARLCPSDPDFHFGVGEMSTYLGRKYQAHRALKRAEELAPVDPQVQAALVHASQAIGHEEERLNRAKLQHKYANRTAAALRAFQNAAEAHDVTAAMKVVDQYVTTNPSDKSLLRELQALLQQQFDEAHARKGPLDRLTERIRNGNGGMSNSTL